MTAHPDRVADVDGVAKTAIERWKARQNATQRDGAASVVAAGNGDEAAAEILSVDRALLPLWPPVPMSDDEFASIVDVVVPRIASIAETTRRDVARQRVVRWAIDSGVPEPWRVINGALERALARRSAAPTDSNAGSGAACGYRLPWRSLQEMAALPPQSYIWYGRYPAGGLIDVVGPSGSGKTLHTLEFSLSVACGGLRCHGYPTTAGRVSYVLAEGRGGISKRVEAWSAARNTPPPDASTFLMLPQIVPLMDPGARAALMADLDRFRPQLVVFDTLALTMAPGDENNTRDMSEFVAITAAIRQATGAAIMFDHHTGWDDSRQRGSSALRAAADCEVLVKKKGVRPLFDVTITNTKQRDDALFPDVYLRMAYSGPSVVLESRVDRGGTLTANEQKALDTLREITVEGESLPFSRWGRATGLSDTSFDRARTRLVTLGVVLKEGEDRQARYRPNVAEIGDG